MQIGIFWQVHCHSLIWITALTETILFSECRKEYILNRSRMTFSLDNHQTIAIYRCSMPYYLPSDQAS
jgi:hypothetical protein